MLCDVIFQALPSPLVKWLGKLARVLVGFYAEDLSNIALANVHATPVHVLVVILEGIKIELRLLMLLHLLQFFFRQVLQLSLLQLGQLFVFLDRDQLCLQNCYFACQDYIKGVAKFAFDDNFAPT